MFEKISQLLLHTPEPNGWYESYPSAFMDGDDDEVPDVFIDNLESEEDKELFRGAKQVESHGGEGEGERYWSVWYFPGANIYVKFFGWYYSYDGATLSEFFEVEPEQVMVTRYKRK